MQHYSRPKQKITFRMCHVVKATKKKPQLVITAKRESRTLSAAP